MIRALATPEARADLRAIWEYIADVNIEAADRVLDQIEEAFNRLADMPGIGHFRLDFLDRRYRFYTVYSYVIAYRWEAQPIEIIAVIHGARNLRAFLRDRDK